MKWYVPKIDGTHQRKSADVNDSQCRESQKSLIQSYSELELVLTSQLFAV